MMWNTCGDAGIEPHRQYIWLDISLVRPNSFGASPVLSTEYFFSIGKDLNLTLSTHVRNNLFCDHLPTMQVGSE